MECILDSTEYVAEGFEIGSFLGDGSLCYWGCEGRLGKGLGLLHHLEWLLLDLLSGGLSLC